LEARQNLKGVGIKVYRTSLADALGELVSLMKIKRIGFDDRHISLAVFKVLKKGIPSAVKLVCVPHLVEELREIKSSYEIDQIREALAIHQQTHQFVKKTIRPGITEKNLLKELENFVRSKDAAFSFPAIIASGPNSCFPHAKVTDRMIRKNETVLVDMGIDLKGYKSDLTRMVFLGKIPRFIRQVHDTVRRAQALAIQKVKPGVLARAVDAAARTYLTKNHLGKFFGHSLGHGVGLEIHEAPRISPKNLSPLKEGMIFTIEPAVYIPHQFGIRIEDMVLVTNKGFEVLSGHIH
jgi:Xaa-Pro aminopeptidase